MPTKDAEFKVQNCQQIDTALANGVKKGKGVYDLIQPLETVEEGSVYEEDGNIVVVPRDRGLDARKPRLRWRRC